MSRFKSGKADANKIALRAACAALLAGVPILACTPLGTALRSGQAHADQEKHAQADRGRGTKIYSAQLKPVQAQGPVTAPSGVANFATQGDTFAAQVQATGLAPNTVQLQHIHMKGKCPTPADDTNGDGYIDAVEEAASTGKILLPLDNSLEQQEQPTASPTPGATPGDLPPGQGGPGMPPSSYLGDNLNPMEGPTPAPEAGYPTTDAAGNLTYSQTASLSAILDDLRKPDPNPNDEVGKLGRNEPLRLNSRTVVIHGVPPDTALPPTVQGIMGLSPQATLPVACGEIQPTAGESPTPSPSPGSPY